MMKKYLFVAPAMLLLLATGCFAMAAAPDSLQGEKKKTGWTWAGLPVIAYDADQGLQLGALGQVFYYGDGSTYPEYKHTVYAECSWFTRGSAVYQLFYDSRYLIPGGIRTTFDLDYLPERALDFYGFNGNEARYDPGFENEGSENYISRMFYRMERKMYRVMADFQGPIAGQKFRWLAGINVFGMKMATVDIERMNKGKADDEKLPDTTLLYDRYVRYGLISGEEKDGGTTIYLKTGLVFDTRDSEAAPDRGIWSEVMLLSAPTFLGNNPYAFIKLAVTHRQYVPLVKSRLTAAYQLSYQGTLGGTTPYYILPYIYTSYSLTTKPDGLGGARTMRGVLRNRITGDGVVFGNVELRWKFLRKVVMKQNLYLGLTAFADGGMTVQEHPVSVVSLPEEQKALMLTGKSETMHGSAGLGLRIGINSNFIIAVDYGVALNRSDGKSGLYIGVGNIF